MKNKYPTVGTVSKCNKKRTKRQNRYPNPIYIHARPLSRLDTWFYIFRLVHVCVRYETSEEYENKFLLSIERY